MNEGDLDRLFADKLSHCREFTQWILRQTRFAEFASRARLLVDEQIAARPHVKAEHWYRHWWCNLPCGSGSETDIFTVFESADIGHRFAIHFENKPPGGRFTPAQQENYRIRGEYMAHQPKFMDYAEFETVLIAPHSTWDTDAAARDCFDLFLPYESIAEWIDEFAI